MKLVLLFVHLSLCSTAHFKPIGWAPDILLEPGRFPKVDMESGSVFIYQKSNSELGLDFVYYVLDAHMKVSLFIVDGFLHENFPELFFFDHKEDAFKVAYVARMQDHFALRIYMYPSNRPLYEMKLPTSDDSILQIFQSQEHLIIITSQNVYRVSPDSLDPIACQRLQLKPAFFSKVDDILFMFNNVGIVASYHMKEDILKHFTVMQMLFTKTVHCIKHDEDIFALVQQGNSVLIMRYDTKKHEFVRFQLLSNIFKPGLRILFREHDCSYYVHNGANTLVIKIYLDKMDFKRREVCHPLIADRPYSFLHLCNMECVYHIQARDRILIMFRDNDWLLLEYNKDMIIDRT